jgi:hypothetical protein
MGTPKEVPMTPNLVRHCHDYQGRAGLKQAGFSVLEDDAGHLWVTSSCEDQHGRLLRASALIANTQSASDPDEDIYLALMLCTEKLLAQQSAIH